MSSDKVKEYWAGQKSDKVWVMRDYPKCTGCRMCEIECSIYHEKKIWPEASMVRVFMLAPGLELPHLCAQCSDYPCVTSCPTKPKKALSIDQKTGAVLVDRKICTSCKNCIRACPGHVPFLHPVDKKATICDLCNGDPQCVKICQEAEYNCLSKTSYSSKGEAINHRLYSKTPKLITEGLSELIYGEKLEV